MIEGLKSYSAYRKSPLPWVAATPEHWRIERGKALFSESLLPVRDDDEIVTCFRDGQVTLRTNRRTRGFMLALHELGYQGVRRGQLVIHAMDAFAGAIGISDSDGKCTPEYIVCDPRSEDVTPAYFSLVLRLAAQQGFILASCPAVRERAPRFRYPHFGAMLLPLPPPDEQAAIVRFLDHANRRIERYIRGKRKLIALLNEQKQAIIHRAVTRGLDPNVPMKDSGVPWLGEIPAHWEVRRAKQLCVAIIDCKNRTPDLVPGGEFTVVRTTNIRHGRFDLKGSYQTDRHHFEIWTQRGAPRVGDVFFTREAPAGEAALVPNVSNLCMGQRMMYFRPEPSLLDPRFLVHSIYGPIVRTYIEHACNGSTVGHLRLGQVGSMPLLWCPVAEQLGIVEFIDRTSAPVNRTISQAEREITLMREYRTRLVADVVTGQLDVREAARTLPEVEPDALVLESGIDTDEADQLDDDLDLADGEAA